MKLLQYLFAIISFWLFVDGKSFQTNIQNVKVKFPHMNENVYLKRTSGDPEVDGGQSYELRYVPHVDGRPIFIPSFNELETNQPQLLKVESNNFKRKAINKILSSELNLLQKKGNIDRQAYVTRISNDLKFEDKDKVIDLESYLPSEKGTEIKPTISNKIKPGKSRIAKPLVKSYGIIKPEDKKPVEKVYENDDYEHPVLIRALDNEHEKNDLHLTQIIKPVEHVMEKDIPLKQESYENDSPVVIDAVKKTDTHIEESDYSKDDYHTPIIVRPMKEKSISKQDHEDKKTVLPKKSYLQIDIPKQTYLDQPEYDSSPKSDLNKLGLQEKTTKLKNDAVSQAKPAKKSSEESFNNEDYDSPVVVESTKKEVSEDYDDTVVIRPFSGKHTQNKVEKKQEIKIKPIATDEPIKLAQSGSFNDQGENPPITQRENFEYGYDKEVAEHYKEKDIDSLSEISNQREKLEIEKLTKVEPSKISTEIVKQKYDYDDDKHLKDNKPLDGIPNESAKKDTSMHLKNTERDFVISNESFENYDDPDYNEEPNAENMLVMNEEPEYDLPIVVEALLKKPDLDQNDKPVVVEALVKRTVKQEDDSSPVIVEALVKKTNKYIGSKEILNENDGYDTPQVVEALVKKDPAKPYKKRVKYFNTTKPTKIQMHSYYEVNSNKPTALEFQTESTLSEFTEGLEKKIALNQETETSFPLQQDNLKNPGTFNNPKTESKQSNLITFDKDERISVTDSDSLLGNIDIDHFDVGSGIINERTNSFDSRSLFLKSNAWNLLTNFHSQERNKFKKCTTPNKEPGNCMPIQMCPVPNLLLTLDDLMQKICTLEELFIGICCPQFPAETLKVVWENLENTSSHEQDTLDTKPEECGTMQEFGKNPHSWPWMAPLISVSTRRIFCGGVLIKEQYVLTAAHCTKKIPDNQIVVVLGAMTSQIDSTNQEFNVIEIKRHAQYNPRTMQNDLALLKLSRRVPIGDARRFICLPDKETFVGEEALMLGWQGSFAASKNEEKLKVISAQECRKGVKIIVGDNIICTEPRTEDVMCNVDSGAPLIVKQNDRYQVIGILTWNRNDCDSSFPSIFTSVSFFKNWIENHSV